jgi:hypothetical protein
VGNLGDVNGVSVDTEDYDAGSGSNSGDARAAQQWSSRPFGRSSNVTTYTNSLVCAGISWLSFQLKYFFQLSYHATAMTLVSGPPTLKKILSPRRLLQSFLVIPFLLYGLSSTRITVFSLVYRIMDHALGAPKAFVFSTN